MTLMLTLFFVAAFFEAVLYYRRLWSFRKVIAAASLVPSAGFIGIATLVTPLYIVMPISFVMLYRLLNIYRFFEGNSHEVRLRSIARLSFIWLTGMQLILLLIHLVLYDSGFAVASLAVAYITAVLLLLTAVVLYLTTHRSLVRMRLPFRERAYVTKSLPTVTIAIPARNETKDLERCLQTIVQSTYPKLEVLVLDDCSQNKRTPEIIRQFAHDGVRFIAGEAPGDEWLAKNYAYHRLANEANGELLLFCGVDTRFEPQTIKILVESMLDDKKDMISFMPTNALPANTFKALLVQPIRYAWEISLPRNWAIRPPVLSTCWLIRKQALRTQGGFEAVRRTILPERFFARELQSDNRYGFYLADDEVGLTCDKQYSEQHDTAIRMRYPQLYKRIETLSLVTLLSMLLAIAPSILVVAAILQQQWVLLALSLSTLVLCSFWYKTVAAVTYQRNLPMSLVLATPALLYDVYLLHVSFWKYEFSEVIWKGRNICIPVMQVYPTLPKLK
jgi:chlorobactene glucosyltransferase